MNNLIEDLKSKLAEKIEFKIEPRKTQNIFLNLEDKLAMIMAKGKADKNDIEEIKIISKQITHNNYIIIHFNKIFSAKSTIINFKNIH